MPFQAKLIPVAFVFLLQVRQLCVNGFRKLTFLKRFSPRKLETDFKLAYSLFPPPAPAFLRETARKSFLNCVFQHICISICMISQHLFLWKQHPGSFGAHLSFLQMWRSEVKWFDLGHRANKWQTEYSSSDLSASASALPLSTTLRRARPASCAVCLWTGSMG